ncbi:MAG TPA: POTRA domain-containing protein [Terriglobales bacterium]|nr:POTRA domain-containing protein [Terriglobales bacterium]
MSRSPAAGVLAYIGVALCAIALSAQSPPPPQPQSPAQPSSPMSTAELNRFLGTKVTRIEFRNLQERADNVESLRDLLPLRVGDELTRNKLRESIQVLYSSGRFATIAAQAEMVGTNESAIYFAIEPNFFIGALTVVGDPRPPSASQLANATKLELGQLFTEESLEIGVNRIKRVMEDNGYYEATVTPEFEFNPRTQQVSILFTIERGPHARVGAVTVTGNPGYPDAEILNTAKIHTGDKVTVARVTRALTRLRKKYQKKNRLEAQVSIASRTYHPDTDRLDYSFNIERGPTVDVKVEGASIRKGLLKKYVPVYEENAVDDDLLNEGRRNIRDYFQTKGFFDVDVEFTHKTEKDHTTVIFDVDRGERHKLTNLDIVGNKYFPKDTILERMQVTPASLLLYHGRFSQTMLARDIEAVEALYRANGFQQVKITSNVEDDYKGENGRMKVTLNVEEGPQTLVESLKIEGTQAVSVDQFRTLINTQEGQPYSDFNIAQDRESVLNYYFNRGFPDVKFEAFAEPIPDNPTRLNVRFKLSEGEQQFVDQVLISGLTHTRRYVVRRELQIKSNDPLSQANMLETQRRLYDLGIFNEVNMAIQNPQGNIKEKNVILQMDEAKRYTFNYGFGVEVQTGDIQSGCKNDPTSSSVCRPQGRTGVSPRVSFDVTRINFLGRDHTVLFKSRLGRLQQRALLSYEAPRWFNRENMTLTFTTFFDKTQDVRTFTAERLEGSVQVQHLVDKATTFLYRLAYRRVQVDPTTLQVSEQDIPLLSRPVRVGLPSITYIRDTRDDPIESKRGSYTTADAGVAAFIFGSESNFTRLLLQNSTYHIFKKRWVFARSARIGVEAPFGNAISAVVPLPERFFGGGSNSHRGFAINQAGPRDLQTGFPLGGEALFVNNLEVRTPPIALPFLGENLSAVVFHDAGNVFSSVDDMVQGFARLSQKHKGDCKNTLNAGLCSFSYISHAIGGGLRYRTPIGPVRVDFGYNLNPPTFSVRTPLDQARTETLKRFNFFFSIGQTF